MMKSLFSIVLASILLGSCTTVNSPKDSASAPIDSAGEENLGETTTTNSEASGITAVSVNETSVDSFTFSVTIASEDTGCDRYANWWEVITEDGTLLYRRILAHSHTDEQPFTRSGGPVEIGPKEVVIVRSHLHPIGYQSQAMQGSFANGFKSIDLSQNFASEVTEQEPLPTTCLF